MFLIFENILSKFKVVVNRGNVIEMQAKNLPKTARIKLYFRRFSLC